MTKRGLMALMTTAGVLAVGGAWAATTTSNMVVTANVIDACTVADDGIFFGDIGTTEAATSSSVISIQCNALTILSGVYVSMGLNPDAGTPVSRQLTSMDGDHIPYTVTVASNLSDSETTNVRNGFQYYNISGTSKYEGQITATIAATGTPRLVDMYSDQLVVTVDYALGDPND